LQFERQGYFFHDPVDSSPEHPVFNRIVPLRDSWAQEAQKQAPAPPVQKVPEPKAPKVKEEKPTEPLSAEEQELLERMRPDVLPLVESVLAAHPNEVERYRKGETGKLGFLIGQVVKRAAQSGGKPNPKLISVVVAEKLSAP
jgi:hypothetical protein